MMGKRRAGTSWLEHVIGRLVGSVIVWLARRAYYRGDLHEYNHMEEALKAGNSSPCSNGLPCSLKQDTIGRPDWNTAWAQLDGYVKAACADGKGISAELLNGYMVELKREYVTKAVLHVVKGDTSATKDGI
jgi:hypothetical protein